MFKREWTPRWKIINDIDLNCSCFTKYLCQVMFSQHCLLLYKNHWVWYRLVLFFLLYINKTNSSRHFAERLLYNKSISQYLVNRQQNYSQNMGWKKNYKNKSAFDEQQATDSTVKTCFPTFGAQKLCTQTSINTFWRILKAGPFY